MILKDFKGYHEGRDITKIPLGALAYPSKNCYVYKGAVYTSAGLTDDGATTTVVEEPVHSEFVWKDAKGGERALRVHGTTLEVKYNDKWYQLFTGLDADTTRVYFTTWIDSNGSIIKKRLCFADGSTSLYQWNGAIGVVESATSNTVTFATADGTCAQQGFDDGTGTNQNILHFIGSAVTPNSTETYSNDASAQVLNLTGTFNTTPVAGDIIISCVKSHANQISSTFAVDVVYAYKNAIISANFDSVNLYWSHIQTYSLSTGWDFAQPVLASRTALTAVFMQLDGNFKGMIARKGTLWVSDENDWYKITKSVEVNPYGLWVTVDKFETGEQKGCLPMALAIYKGDVVYFSQEGTLQRVVTNEITGVDELFLLSDDVELLFNRLNKTDVRVYYFTRAIYIIFPRDSTLVLLDMIEQHWQPPQIIPINCMSVISGVKYGHHNVESTTYELFSGYQNLGVNKESVIALGYVQGKDPFRAMANTLMGVSSRVTFGTSVDVKMLYNEQGSTANPAWTFGGNDGKRYFATEDDNSWGTNPYGTYSLGALEASSEDEGSSETFQLKRAIRYTKVKPDSWFDWRPVMTISGANNKMVLLGVYMDEDPSQNTIPQDLFVDK